VNVAQLRTSAREAWGTYIGQAQWDVLVTLTDLRHLHPEAMAKRAGYLEGLVNDDLYGRNWKRKGQRIESVTALELQSRGAVHAHMLWRLPDHDARDPVVFSLARWRKVARELGGDTGRIIDLDYVHSDQVGAYVSKYCTKDGEFTLSPGYDPAKPRTYGQTLAGAAEAAAGRTADHPHAKPALARRVK
jgi:hypothetical protein